MSVMLLVPVASQRVPVGGRDLSSVTSAASRSVGVPTSRAFVALSGASPTIRRQLALSAVLTALLARHSSPSLRSRLLAVTTGGSAKVFDAWGAASPASVHVCGHRRSRAAARGGRRPFGRHCGIDFDQLAVTPNPSLQRTLPGRSPGQRR